jgi:transcriptional regulator with AAA-type ATPase domain
MPIQARDQRAPDDRSQDNLEQDIIGRSPAIHQLRERVHALADLQVPVLIRGEPGTGRRAKASISIWSSWERMAPDLLQSAPANASSSWTWILTRGPSKLAGPIY